MEGTRTTIEFSEDYEYWKREILGDDERRK